MIEVKFIPTYEKVLWFFWREVSLKLIVDWSGGRWEYNVSLSPVDRYEIYRGDLRIRIEFDNKNGYKVIVGSEHVATLKSRYMFSSQDYNIEVGNFSFEFTTETYPVFRTFCKGLRTFCKELEGVTITRYRYQFGDCAERIGIDVIAMICEFIRNEYGR